ncbi:DNA polymerase III subunit alpha [Candidatus Methylacidithermus pantelleriae]|uniref:DNA polymerase III subunit alpha n=1 Tax=Candidatus Methylacidithermus pantelleriae TaxID=2744239 RepID=A0A8J2BFX3_9BACT|nr:DNA polymerase III subunit alpha [Candidatus Methylacidithermus pantelleriae]CAF0689571.1 DNA polymerase III alpha subunit [Candidatus Methylacidithermus pantelleriae]
MGKRRFIHLHVRSEYSLLRAYCPIPELVRTAAELEMPALALTDEGVLYGAVEFYRTCRAHNIQPILGCEIHVEEVAAGCGERLSRPPGSARSVIPNTAKLILLVKDSSGYENLLQLVSHAHLHSDGSPPRVGFSTLQDYAQGLVGISPAHSGPVSKRILGRDFAGAANMARTLEALFGRESFYLEIVDHGLPEELYLRKRLRELARELGIGLVATNDVYYVRPEHAALHEILLCIGAGVKLADPQRPRLPGSEFYLKSPEQMEELFGEEPSALETTVRIREQCRFELELGRNHFPTYIPPDGSTPEAYLRHLCEEGIRSRYGRESKLISQVRERLNYELAIIERLGFASYFLVVWDFIRFAREQGIPVGPGRGSAAGSLVAYLLRITDVDPLKYGLFFERFLNPERVSLPDIDIDFCYNRREEVIAYVRRRYGEESVAQIITFARLAARMAIRDVARVLGLSYGQADRLAKLVPSEPHITLNKALEEREELRSLAKDEVFRPVMEYASLLEGVPRQPGVHAAGVVIAPGAIARFVPLTRGENDVVVTQWAMEELELVGLLKMDFLGLKTLTVMQDCVELIRKETGNPHFSLEAVPLDDPKTFELLSLGKTVGVFQLESPGMRELCRRLQPGRLEDLIALVALYRPGPMENIGAYAERKLGLRPIQYDHPSLEPILKETYGVMIYQEQVMQAAHVLAGYTLGQADLLRRAMGKKKAEEMRAQKESFVEGACKLHGMSREEAERIFGELERFAGYGFNKAHSVCYGLLAYRMAYLKAHFPAIFFACSLSSEIGDTERIAELVREARMMGIELLPPDLNRSFPHFSFEDGAVRCGLAAIKNVGVSQAGLLVREREAAGPYASLEDVFLRIPEVSGWNRKALESLIKAGACDGWKMPRLGLCRQIDSGRKLSRSAAEEKSQGFLFEGKVFREGFSAPKPPEGDLSTDGSMGEDLAQRLAWEKELLGFYWSGHPIQGHQRELEALGLAPLESLEDKPDGGLVWVGGVVTRCDIRLAARDRRPFGRVVLEDQKGSVEVMVFPDLYRKKSELLREGEVLVVAGTISRRGEKEEIRATEVLLLKEALQSWVEGIVVTIPPGKLGMEDWEKLVSIVRRHPGKAKVFLAYHQPKSSRCLFLEAGESFRVSPGQGLEEELASVLGLPRPRYLISLPGKPRSLVTDGWSDPQASPMERETHGQE